MAVAAGLRGVWPQLRFALRQGDVLLGIGVLAILVVLILPLPGLLLDLCLAISITLAVLILLTALFIFPASLLRPFGGIASDRFGARKVMYVTLLVSALVTLVLALPVAITPALFLAVTSFQYQVSR